MLNNRLSAGQLPTGDIDVTYMVSGMDITEVVSMNVEQTIADWVRQHNDQPNATPLGVWEVNEAKRALQSLVSDATEGHNWALRS